MPFDYVINVGGTEIISLMIYPFFFLSIAFLMHKRQELFMNSKEKNPLHSFFFVMFLSLGMFSMFVPLTTLDTFFNSTAPYNDTVSHVIAPSILTLGVSLTLFLFLILTYWIIKLLQRKEEML